MKHKSRALLAVLAAGLAGTALFGEAVASGKTPATENNLSEERSAEMMEQEISRQFEEFCQTKGITAKFKVAFANMAENTRRQKEADKANFEEVKRKSAEANPEFTEFLYAKGLKAKLNVIVENIKKGAQEAPQKTAASVKKAKARAKASAAYGQSAPLADYSADDLSREFNEFLKAKGLDGTYTVEVTEAGKTEN